MRTVSRLLLLLLLLRPSRASFYTMGIATTLCPQSYGFHIPVLSTHLLVALSKLCTPIIISLACLSEQLLMQMYLTQSTLINFQSEYVSSMLNPIMVEVGGFAPPSRTLFSLLHTAITNIITLFIQLVNQYGIICFTVRNKILDVVITFFDEHLWMFRVNCYHNYNL